MVKQQEEKNFSQAQITSPLQETTVSHALENKPSFPQRKDKKRKIFVLGLLLFLFVFILFQTASKLKLIQPENELSSSPGQKTPTLVAIPTTADLCQCPQEFQPVCGKNYASYPNECLAKCEGVEVLYQGECKALDPNIIPPPACPVCDITCAENEEMYLDASDCPNCECI